MKDKAIVEIIGKSAHSSCHGHFSQKIHIDRFQAYGKHKINILPTYCDGSFIRKVICIIDIARELL
jgi:hypothetical protein